MEVVQTFSDKKLLLLPTSDKITGKLPETATAVKSLIMSPRYKSLLEFDVFGKTKAFLFGNEGQTVDAALKLTLMEIIHGTN
jgi:hypothetical protein